MAAVGTIQTTLSEIHLLLAATLQAPELVLEEGEAKSLATALHNVGKHYTLPIISAEKMALGVLVWTLGKTYFPKVKAISDRKRRKTVASPVSRPAPVVTPSAGPSAENVDWFAPMSGSPN